MRDLVVTALVFASLPLILRKPFLGVLVWTWLGLMNPHRLCWGFATTMPFSYLVAIATLTGLLISKEVKAMPWTALTRLLVAWWLWMFVTTLFALVPEAAWGQWDKVWRILLLTFVAVLLLNSRERLDALIWIIVISLGFYGVKGGIFTLTSGGNYNVWGPAGTFIGGNNELGLALIMTIPLMRYIQLTSGSKIVKNGMLGAIALSAVAILGTHSRGAFLGGAVMVFFLVLKSRNRARLLAVMAILLPAAYLFMPESWHMRMDTIQNYEQDGSAMGRINAWWTGWYIALDRPFVGGGFNVTVPWVFAKYAPNPADLHDFHSIYFKALGEHGFIGLALFLSIGIVSFLSLGRVALFAVGRGQVSWMRDMATMVQVAILGYAASGAFLGLTYFDYYYTLVAVAIGLLRVKKGYEAELATSVTARAPEDVPPTPAIRPTWGSPTSERQMPPRRKPLFGFDFREWYSKL